MIRFYNISTTEFRPISFENVYLYAEYNKIKNFLISNNQQELLKVLAVPSYKKNNIEWSAISNNEIKKLDEYSKTQQDKILSQYNEFLNSYNSFINNLRSSKNQDNKNWGELLFSLIEGTANELFFDGENLFITWGWRLLDENSKKLIPVYSPPPSVVETMTPIIEDVIDEPEVIPIIDEYEPFEEVEKLSWLDRFYLFLKRIWWLIPMLSVIILILVLLKACENNECDPVCVDLDNRLDSLGYLLDSCDCGEVVVRGCMDKRYKEYNPDANVDDGSCKNNLYTKIDGIDVKKPTENCRAHFTGCLINDSYDDGHNSLIFKLDKYSEYVGEGDYPRASRAFAKASGSSFDGIAIDKNTRVIIYSRRNFKGNVVLDVTGPALINNIKWKGDASLNDINNRVLNQPYEKMFPKSCRRFSKSDMNSWSNGSLKVICNE